MSIVGLAEQLSPTAKTENKLLHFVPATTKQEWQCLECLLGSEDSTFHTFEYCLELKKIKSYQGLRAQKEFPQFQTVRQVGLLLGPYDPTGPMVLVVSVLRMDTMLTNHSRKITTQTQNILAQDYAICSGKLYSFPKHYATQP